MKLALVLAAAAAVTAPAFAQDAAAAGDFRASVGYSSWDADDGDLGAIGARATYFFNQNFGIEGELGFGAGEEDVAGAEVKIDNSFGAFAVAKAPLGENFEVFGRLGYASTTIGVDAGALSGDADIKGVAYGVGANLFFSPNFGVRGDFSQYDGGDDFDGSADVFSISAVFRF